MVVGRWCFPTKEVSIGMMEASTAALGQLTRWRAGSFAHGCAATAGLGGGACTGCIGATLCYTKSVRYNGDEYSSAGKLTCGGAGTFDRRGLATAGVGAGACPRWRGATFCYIKSELVLWRLIRLHKTSLPPGDAVYWPTVWRPTLLRLTVLQSP